MKFRLPKLSNFFVFFTPYMASKNDSIYDIDPLMLGFFDTTFGVKNPTNLLPTVI